MRKKFDSFSQGVDEGDNGLLQVYADDSVFCKKKKKKKKNERKTGSPISGKTKMKDKINILHDNVLDNRGLNVMLKTKIRLRTKATMVGEI